VAPRRKADGTADGGADGDSLSVLLAIARQRRALEAAEQEMIERARREGVTLERIGTALGVTRQAIHARLRKSRSGGLAVGALVGYHDLLDALTAVVG
jgi:hypothetical protein